MRIGGIDIYLLTWKGQVLDPFTTLHPAWKEMCSLTGSKMSYYKMLKHFEGNDEFSFEGYVIRRRRIRTKFDG